MLCKKYYRSLAIEKAKGVFPTPPFWFATAITRPIQLSPSLFLHDISISLFQVLIHKMFHVKHSFSIFHKYKSVLFVIFVIFMLFHSFYFLMFHVKHFLWLHRCSFCVHFAKAIFQFISKYSIISSKKVRYQHELEKDIIVHLDSNRNNNPGVPRNKQIHIQHLW